MGVLKWTLPEKLGGGTYAEVTDPSLERDRVKVYVPAVGTVTLNRDSVRRPVPEEPPICSLVLDTKSDIVYQRWEEGWAATDATGEYVTWEDIYEASIVTLRRGKYEWIGQALSCQRCARNLL